MDDGERIHRFDFSFDPDREEVECLAGPPAGPWTVAELNPSDVSSGRWTGSTMLTRAAEMVDGSED
jgi:hypothetical protein